MLTFPRNDSKLKRTSSNLILSRKQYHQVYCTAAVLRVPIIGTPEYDDAPPSQLATQPGFRANYILNGNLVSLRTKSTFSRNT